MRESLPRTRISRVIPEKAERLARKHYQALAIKAWAVGPIYGPIRIGSVVGWAEPPSGSTVTRSSAMLNCGLSTL